MSTSLFKYRDDSVKMEETKMNEVSEPYIFLSENGRDYMKLEHVDGALMLKGANLGVHSFSYGAYDAGESIQNKGVAKVYSINDGDLHGNIILYPSKTGLLMRGF